MKVLIPRNMGYMGYTPMVDGYEGKFHVEFFFAYHSKWPPVFNSLENPPQVLNQEPVSGSCFFLFFSRSNLVETRRFLAHGQNQLLKRSQRLMDENGCHQLRYAHIHPLHKKMKEFRYQKKWSAEKNEHVVPRLQVNGWLLLGSRFC